MIRVSQVCSFFLNLWKVPEEVLARKGNMGSLAHDAIYHYMMMYPFGRDRYKDQEIYPYLVSFGRWFEKNKPGIHKLETRYNDTDLGLTGEPDAVFDIGGKLVLYDFKTSAKDDPVTWRMQGSAYVHLLRRNGIMVEDVFYFLKLDKFGNEPRTFAYKYTEENWDVFLKAMDCAKYFLKWKGSLPE